MKRADCLKAIYKELEKTIVVTIMGASAQELYNLGDRDKFFYLQHGMGLASSVGLGIALNRPKEQVVVIDGDGSLMMNLGTLITIGRYRPKNLIHLVFDNGSLLSTGGYPSHTSHGGVDFPKIAEGAGCPNVRFTESVDAFAKAMTEAVAADEMFTIVAPVEPVGPKDYGMDFALPENGFRFYNALNKK